MKPNISKTSFGSIKVAGEGIQHDIFITLGGKIKKRKKKLSKAVHGTSHIISLDEIRHVYEDGARGIIIGSGQYGAAELSAEAGEFLKSKTCQVHLSPTPEAIQRWNDAEGEWIGLFHITC